MQIGLFFGSFNPIHNGHLAIAEYFLNHTALQEIWFVVSPLNPFKINNANLLHENIRLKMLELAIANNLRLKPCTIEFDLPVPSYTVNTLEVLRNNYPSHLFTPIIGGDNLQTFHQWKEYDKILSHHQIYVYKRKEFEANTQLKNHTNIIEFDVPLLDISSTAIREEIKKGNSIARLVPHSVEAYILSNKLYH